MLQLSADEIQWIKNAVHGKQIFLVADESTLSGILSRFKYIIELSVLSQS